MSHLGDLLSALIDGELSGAELDRANAHLARAARAGWRRARCDGSSTNCTRSLSRSA